MQGKDNGSRQNGARQRFPWDDGHQFPQTIEEMRRLSVEELDRAIKMVQNWQKRRLKQMLQEEPADPAQRERLRSAILKLRKALEENAHLKQKIRNNHPTFLTTLAKMWFSKSRLPLPLESDSASVEEKFEEAVRGIAGVEKMDEGVSLPQAENGSVADDKMLEYSVEQVSGSTWIAILKHEREQKVSGAPRRAVSVV